MDTWDADHISWYDMAMSCNRFQKYVYKSWKTKETNKNKWTELKLFVFLFDIGYLPLTSLYLSFPLFTSLYLSFPIFTYHYLSFPLFSYLYLSFPIFSYLFLSLPLFTSLSDRPVNFKWIKDNGLAFAHQIR